MMHMGRILLVDDSEMARFLLARFLTGGGHEIVGEAANGIEAIEKVRETAPDLVILDLIMPQMKGIQTLEEIKKVSPKTSVVICTGDHQEYTVREAVRKGASGFIIKPFDKDIVLDEINTVLAGKQP
ncbi:MAG TPA: response regulator [Methanolinea sp.]|jgi:two-component system chemotaxis response regulator CheY|nr:response regulator [Methanolinea sp.]